MLMRLWYHTHTHTHRERERERGKDRWWKESKKMDGWQTPCTSHLLDITNKSKILTRETLRLRERERERERENVPAK